MTFRARPSVPPAPVTADRVGVSSGAMRVVALLGLLTALVASARAQAWVEIATSARPSPGFRAMAFDPVRERLVCVVDEVVFVGPFSTSGRLVVWEWDGSGWLRIDTPTTVTTLNRAIALAWDPPNRRLLCVGSLQNNTAWAYDGTDWQSVMNPESWPQPSLCFDHTRSVMVSVRDGGINERVGNQWVFRTWLPPAVLSTAAAFDPVSGTVILHGGLSLSGPVTGTWTWNGTTLQQVPTTLTPPARYGHTFSEDPVSGRLLVCGGRDAVSQAPIDSVLQWTGSDWLVQPALPQPTAEPVAAPFDGAVRILASDAMWTRQAGGTYTTLPLPATMPPGPCVYDPLRQRTVGVGDGTTHEFDGYAWTRTNVPAPSSSAIAGMTWHAGLGRIVAVDANVDLFTFDGTSWAPLPATNKPGFAWPTLTYDVQRQCLAMALGNSVYTMANGTWSLEPTLPFTGTIFHRDLAYDHATQRLVCSAGDQVVARTATGWTALPSLPIPVLRSDLVSDGANLWAQEQRLWDGAGNTFRFAGSAWSLVANANGAYSTPIHDGVRGTLMLHSLDKGLALSSTVATSTRFGAGCSSTPELPRLHAPKRPGIGQRVLLDLDRCAPTAIAGLFVDFAAASVPLPGGCTLLLQAPTLLDVDVTNAHGGAGWSWSVPRSPSLRGALVYHQALVLSPSGAFPGLGDLSNGVQLLVGD